MIFDPKVETRDRLEQRAEDDALYRKQVAYLFERSPFYRKKLNAAGFKDAKSVGGFDDMHNLPFTEKDEIRKTQEVTPPFGEHLAVEPERLMRVYSTSGTTGTPCFIGLTKNDMEVWATHTARSYTAVGFRPGQRLVVAFNAGPFVAGAAYFGFDKLGSVIIPVGTGNTERFVKAIQHLGGKAISCTPSYALYLKDWCEERGIKPRSLGLTNIGTAGEPGGGDPAIRERIESAFGARVREAMGTGDISTSIWGECEDGNGMHFSGQGMTHAELIDPSNNKVVPWDDGAEGEIIYTALKREAMPMLRLRSRDHVRINMKPCSCGRTGIRLRCIGRTDDMLIVRGVNLFPTAVREVVTGFRPRVGEIFVIQPARKGVSQDPPLPITVELGEGVSSAPDDLGEQIQTAIRSRLLVTTKVSFVPYGTLPRSEYKAKLLDFSRAQ